MDIGKKLKEKRLEANLTQQELAEHLHVSRQTISSWEVGRTYPDLDVLVTISALYDTPLDDLLKEDSQMINDITEKVKKSERRKVTNIVLGALLIFVIGMGLFTVWEDYQNNQVNAHGLRPNDLIESTWKMYYTPSPSLADSMVSFDSDSVVTLNKHAYLLDPNVHPLNLEDPPVEELVENPSGYNTSSHDNLTIEVTDNAYLVSAHGYHQRFERLSETVIRDNDGTEYFKISPASSHESFKSIEEHLE